MCLRVWAKMDLQCLACLQHLLAVPLNNGSVEYGRWSPNILQSSSHKGFLEGRIGWAWIQVICTWAGEVHGGYKFDVFDRREFSCGKGWIKTQANTLFALEQASNLLKVEEKQNKWSSR